MKRLIILFSSLIELITLHAWLACIRFSDIFHFDSLDITYQIDTSINAFHGMPMKMARLFHNKLIQYPIDFIRLYFQFWDIRFGSSWFSLVGYFGIIVGFYYVISNKKKKLYHWFTLIILAILPCIEIFIGQHVPFLLKIVYLWLPFSLFSLYGVYQFITHGNKKKRILIILIVLLLSAWWLIILPHAMFDYCIRPLTKFKLR